MYETRYRYEKGHPFIVSLREKSECKNSMTRLRRFYIPARLFIIRGIDISTFLEADSSEHEPGATGGAGGLKGRRGHHKGNAR